MLTECIIMIVAGLIMIIFGIITVSQDAFFLPWLSRTHIPDHLLNKYANGMGLGSLFIGLGISAAGITRLFIQNEIVWIIIAAGSLAGVLTISVTYFAYGRYR